MFFSVFCTLLAIVATLVAGVQLRGEDGGALVDADPMAAILMHPSPKAILEADDYDDSDDDDEQVIEYEAYDADDEDI